MACFSWLHLTDLHRGMKKQGWLWPGVREIFFNDLKNLYDKCGPWDLVLFTGDLTQRGSAEEFQKVNEVLGQLWEFFRKLGSSPKLLAVPGNHDLARPSTRDPSVKLLQQWPDQPDIQEEFWDDPGSSYRQVVTQAFKNYTAWWEQQPHKVKDIKPGILPGDFSAMIKKKRAKLGIVGLNTAFLQLTDEDYKGKLALHSLQFHEACPPDGPKWAKQHHACLLLTHHPPAWLSTNSQEHLYQEITDHGRFAVHLCGHMHKTVYREFSESGNKAQRIWQGRSLFGIAYLGNQQKEQRSHGYTVGRIELHGDKGTLKFWPREARLQGHDRNIVLDQSVKLTDKQHTPPEEFDLLHPYINRKKEFFQQPVKPTITSIQENILRCICVCLSFKLSGLEEMLHRFSSTFQLNPGLFFMQVGELINQQYFKAESRITDYIVDRKKINAFEKQLQPSLLYELHHAWREWFQQEFDKFFEFKDLSALIYHEALCFQYSKNAEQSILDYLKLKLQESLVKYYSSVAEVLEAAIPQEISSNPQKIIDWLLSQDEELDRKKEVTEYIEKLIDRIEELHVFDNILTATESITLMKFLHSLKAV